VAKIIPFPMRNEAENTIKNPDFSEQVWNHYIEYVEAGKAWQLEKKKATFYEGYPFKAPCTPLRTDMIWYVNDAQYYGVWIVNQCGSDIVEIAGAPFGWSPYVRHSTAPIYEPIQISSMELRKHIVWIVDQDGYGQYGVVKQNGDLWIPIPRPDGWGE
jgi:hypothetical protein